MGATQYYTATTLDGYIADEHNSLEWLFEVDRDAEDVGAAAEYLLGEGAKNVTGTTLYVDSGYHAMGM